MSVDENQPGGPQEGEPAGAPEPPATPPTLPPWLRSSAGPEPVHPGDALADRPPSWERPSEPPPVPPTTTPESAASAPSAETPAAAPSPPDAAATPPPPPEATVPPPPPPPPAYVPAAAAAVEAEPVAPRLFGDRMAVGVLLTLAGGSAAAGGILALQQADPDTLSYMWRALICGGIAAVLLAGAVLLRLVRGSEDLRSLLAVVGIAYATACLAFAYDPADAGDHDDLVKFVLGAGLVAVLGWFTAVVVPSAVAALLGALALPTAAGAAVWVGIDNPTHAEVYVAALGVGLALALLLPRFALARPHPRALPWALAGAALAVAVPATALLSRDDPVAMAAGASAGAGLLLLAQRHRHLPAAVGALACLAALEAVLVTRFITESGSGGGLQTNRLIVVAVIGAVLVALLAVGVLLGNRRRDAMPRRALPVAAVEVFLLAALALSLVSLFTGPSGDVPFNPTQLTTGTTATHAVPHALVRPA